MKEFGSLWDASLVPPSNPPMDAIKRPMRQTPPAGKPPLATPPGTPLVRHSLGRHPPLWADTHPTGQIPTPLSRHPAGRNPSAQCMLGYGQQWGRTHPTGMHSCSNIFTEII